MNSLGQLRHCVIYCTFRCAPQRCEDKSSSANSQLRSLRTAPDYVSQIFMRRDRMLVSHALSVAFLGAYEYVSKLLICLRSRDIYEDCRLKRSFRQRTTVQRKCSWHMKQIYMLWQRSCWRRRRCLDMTFGSCWLASRAGVLPLLHYDAVSWPFRI